ncbi:hypothetical protein [Zunongwangia sp. H14]|uniref:hypothetical protein n=1 Tax=Zunongwangia sp. H14 TaxID=3240792 RepID=UPI0035669F19
MIDDYEAKLQETSLLKRTNDANTFKKVIERPMDDLNTSTTQQDPFLYVNGF